MDEVTAVVATVEVVGEAAVVVATVEEIAEDVVRVEDVVGAQDSCPIVPSCVNVEPDSFTIEPLHITLIVPPTSLISVLLLKMPALLPELSTFRTPELLTFMIPEL